ncbi:MAG: DUF456 domain-containing protein [Acidimicrobiia bacterium]
MTSAEILLTALAAAIIMVGVIGTILPILPGLPLIWATMIGYGLMTEFGVAGWLAMAVATFLVVYGMYLNVRIPQRSASGSGLSIKAQILAAVVAVIGFFAFPPFGAAIGFVGAVYAMRWRDTRDTSVAWHSTKATSIALLKASAAQVAIAIVMFVAWLGWVGTIALT